MVTGVDLIKEQIKIASGEKLEFTQDDIKLDGHAIECRINAEDPDKNFMPNAGTIKEMYMPGGNGVRVDSSIYSGYEINPFYDSMLAKLIVHGKSRKEAIDKMRSALGEVIIEGIKSNVDYQYKILWDKIFEDGSYDVDFIEKFNQRI